MAEARGTSRRSLAAFLSPAQPYKPRPLRRRTKRVVHFSKDTDVCPFDEAQPPGAIATCARRHDTVQEVERGGTTALRKRQSVLDRYPRGREVAEMIVRQDEADRREAARLLRTWAQRT